MNDKDHHKAMNSNTLTCVYEYLTPTKCTHIIVIMTVQYPAI